MALHLLWVPSTICKKERNPPNLTLHKPSQTLNSLSSLCFSNSSSSTTIRKQKKNPFIIQYSFPTQQQLETSAAKAVETPTDESGPKTRLLAQNVPWTCTDQDIKVLFEKYGTVLDVELSMHSKTKNRGLAFVTMGSEEEAVAAMTNLEAYDFDGRILKIAYAHPKKKKEIREAPPAPTKFNVFVGNLSWDVTSSGLREFFSSLNDNVVSAEVIYQTTELRKPSGYGFVSFGSKEEAEAAITAFKGKILMGRPLRLARSRRKLKEEVKVGTAFGGTSSEVNED
ncbi:multiple RNA-binding domain-containing protein 1-like isoform X1 [Papaver somniferum]|uniref:multiple RNA-binding domain-containing protein 1-like isoform X1 n=1 Tax=Papaver somniferum TaxID=3469 RepID=UPI000E7016D5|nr:multiple RNA-binding domain-containing protein 1-like isoform X1 [Papaver somniferum]